MNTTLLTVETLFKSLLMIRLKDNVNKTKQSYAKLLIYKLLLMYMIFQTSTGPA